MTEAGTGPLVAEGDGRDARRQRRVLVGCLLVPPVVVLAVLALVLSQCSLAPEVDTSHGRGPSRALGAHLRSYGLTVPAASGASPGSRSRHGTPPSFTSG